MCTGEDAGFLVGDAGGGGFPVDHSTPFLMISSLTLKSVRLLSGEIEGRPRSTCPACTVHANGISSAEKQFDHTHF